MTTLHIVSWNVAGFSTTLERIKSRHQSIDEWLRKTKTDILCLQEIKMNANELTMRAREFVSESDFDTFWAYPKSTSKLKGGGQGAGLNGVATFVRKGLTCKANSRPLGENADDSHFDDEGRCLMTDHGSFVLFNVYAPYSGENHVRLHFKMKFLSKLKKAAALQRKLGKQVIIAGDLNVAPRPRDVARLFRKINMTTLLNTAHVNLPNEELFNELQYAKNIIKLTWPSIETSLRESRSIEIEEYAIGQSKIANRFRVCVVRGDGKKVKLGKGSASYPYLDYIIDEVLISSDSNYIFHSNNHMNKVIPIKKNRTEIISPDEIITFQAKMSNENGVETFPSYSQNMYNDYCSSNKSIVIRNQLTLPLDELKDVYQKLASLPNSFIPNEDNDTNHNETSMEFITSLSELQWKLIADVYGEPAHTPDTVKWFESLINEDNMVDTFASSYPTAAGRYTCWDQSSNKRYSNEGSRIDHIIVDNSLWQNNLSTNESKLSSEFSILNPISDPNGNSLSSKDSINQTLEDDADHLIALAACTADGRFKMAPFGGGGIPDAPASAYEHQFSLSPHTGIIYTPPEFSDHVAVSAIITTSSTICAYPLSLEKDAQTKATQPHKTQSSIKSFFGAKRIDSSNASSQIPASEFAIQTDAKFNISSVTTNYNRSISQELCEQRSIKMPSFSSPMFFVPNAASLSSLPTTTSTKITTEITAAINKSIKRSNPTECSSQSKKKSV